MEFKCALKFIFTSFYLIFCISPKFESRFWTSSPQPISRLIDWQAYRISGTFFYLTYMVCMVYFWDRWTRNFHLNFNIQNGGFNTADHHCFPWTVSYRIGVMVIFQVTKYSSNFENLKWWNQEGGRLMLIIKLISYSAFGSIKCPSIFKYSKCRS